MASPLGTCKECGKVESHIRRGFCNRCYKRDRKARGILPRRPPKPARVVLSPMERLLSRVVAGPGGCWLLDSAMKGTGYGSFSINKDTRLAHRSSYILFRGAIPDGLEIDHVCHNRDKSCPGGACLHRRCVNPDHLEAVPHQINTLRSPVAIAARWARRTHCERGHEFNEKNTGYYPRRDNRTKMVRFCIPCRRARSQRQQKAKAA